MADEKPKYDKLGRKLGLATQFVKEMSKAAAHYAQTGQLAAPDATVERRLSVCKSCPKFTGTTCSVCGCAMKFKAVLHTSSCPIGKW